MVLTNDLQITLLADHRSRVDLTHVVTPVFLGDLGHVEGPRLVRVVGHVEPLQSRNHLSVDGHNHLAVQMHPSNLEGKKSDSSSILRANAWLIPPIGNALRI